MRLFSTRQLRDAQACADWGGQALHLMTRRLLRGKRTSDAGEVFGHLLDHDVARLKETAARLGVRQIAVHHEGTDRQHVDLWGGPLAAAFRECAR